MFKGRKWKFMRWAFMLILVLMSTVCAAGVLRVQAADDDLDVGANGKLTDGGHTANVVITVTNNGDNFGGYVRLYVSEKYNHNDHQMAYECYISVAEDETENVTISFPVPEGMDLENAKMEVDILNEKKTTTLKIQKLYHLFDSNGSAQIGLLCDEPSALDYLTRSVGIYNYNYNYNTNAQNYESQPLMPGELTDGITLSTMTMLVIDDFDISSLKKDEITAIQNWVKSGGILVIGTGENGDETFDAFDDDFIDASLASRQPYEDYSYYANSGYIMFSDISYGKTYVQNMARDAQMKTEGRGGIVLAQFALTDPDLDTGYFTTDLFATTTAYFSTANVKRYELSDNEMENLFGVMQGKANLNAKLLGAIVVIYVILVGPVLYLVLKKYDKREKIWYAVPAMSVVFVLIVFLASRGFAIKNRMFETIRVARADGTGMEADYIFGFSSSQKPWTLNLDEDTESAGPISLTDSYNNVDQYQCLTSRNPKGMQISYRPNNVFESAFFKSTQSNPDEYGELSFELEMKRSGITGTIDNDTDFDFDYVLVVCDGYYQIIPDVESGDRYTLSGFGRNQYNNETAISQQARQLYSKEDYRSAKLYAALTMAAHELQGESVFVVGITSSKDKILQGIGNSEESFLCIYETE